MHGQLVSRKKVECTNSLPGLYSINTQKNTSKQSSADSHAEKKEETQIRKRGSMFNNFIIIENYSS